MLTIAFYDENQQESTQVAYKQEGRKLANPTPFSFFEIPLSYFKPFSPINLEVFLPVDTKDQLLKDLDAQQYLDASKSAIDPRLQDLIRLREQKQRYLPDFNPKVFLSLELMTSTDIEV